MAPQTTSTQHSARSINGPEAARQPLGERIWFSTSDIVQRRVASAREHLGPEAPTDKVLQLARAGQLRMLQGATEEWSTAQTTANQIALLGLEAPVSVEAQRILDGRERPETSERKRLVAVLSASNAHLADALTYMPPSMLGGFPQRLYKLHQAVGERYGVAVPTTPEFNSQLRGVSREVAFGRALTELPEEMSFRTTTVEEDMKGLDIVVSGQNNWQLGFDLKTEGAYRIKADKKIRDGYADTWRDNDPARGYLRLTNVDDIPMPVYMVNADAFGPIEDFTYDEAGVEKAVALVEQLMGVEQQRTLQKLGRFARTK